MSLPWFMTTPTPIPGFDGDPNQVTPGAVGFAAIAVVAIAAIVIAVDMVRRVRRVRYREQVRDEIAAERAERGVDDPAS